jgi:tetratricopeptide (TPR) repeat protein
MRSKKTPCVFVSYNNKDENLYKKLKTSLYPLTRQGIISQIYDHDNILPGEDKEKEVTSQLDKSSIILLLLSPDYLEKCFQDMEQVFQRQKEAQIIPILLRHCLWENVQFLKGLQILPRNRQPAAEKNVDVDKAFRDIAQEIKTKIELTREDTQLSFLDSESWLEKCQHLLQEKNYEEALQLSKQAIQAESLDAMAYLLKAQALYNLERLSEAKQSCKDAIRINPQLTDAHIYLGLAYYRLGKYQKALEAFDKAVAIDPNSAQAYEYKARALCRLERYEDALTSCKQAIELDNELAGAYDAQGWAYYKLKQYQEALEACEQALDLNDELATAYYNKGRVLYQLENDNGALEAYKQALKYFNKDIDENKHATHLYRNLANVHCNKALAHTNIQQYTEALESYSQAIQFYKDLKLHLDCATAYSDKAETLILYEHYSDALRACEIAIAMYSQHKHENIPSRDLAIVHSHAGHAHYKLRHYHSGLEECNKAIEYDHDLAKAHYYKADNLEKLGRRRRVEEERRIARNLDARHE